MPPRQVTRIVSYIMGASRVDHFLTFAPRATKLIRDTTLNWFSWYCWEILSSEGKKEENIWLHQMRTRLCKCCSFIYLFFCCVYLMCVLMCAARQRSVCLCKCPMCFFFLSTEQSITQPHSSPADPVVLLPVRVGADLRRVRAFTYLLWPTVSIITGVLMHSVNRMGFFFPPAGAGARMTLEVSWKTKSSFCRRASKCTGHRWTRDLNSGARLNWLLKV